MIKKSHDSNLMQNHKYGFTSYCCLIAILKKLLKHGLNDAMGNIQRCFALSLPVKSQKIGPLPPLPSLLLAKVCSQAVSQRGECIKTPNCSAAAKKSVQSGERRCHKRPFSAQDAV